MPQKDGLDRKSDGSTLLKSHRLDALHRDKKGASRLRQKPLGQDFEKRVKRM